MLSPCFPNMKPEKCNSLLSTTNAVESHNCFCKGDHPETPKLVMLSTYKEDIAKTLEVMARQQGLSTTYDTCRQLQLDTDPNSKMKLGEYTE